MNYTILRISPTSPNLPLLTTKFRAFKLAALLAEPDGFAVQHENENLHPLSVWQQRLSPGSTILICVASPSSPVESSVERKRTEEEVLLEDEWVGMAVLQGPLPADMYYIPGAEQPDSLQKDLEDLESRYHLCKVYTSPAHRNRGLARKIISVSILTARQRTSLLPNANINGKDKLTRIRLAVNPKKEYLVKMYEKVGFRDVGRCTLREAMGLNGDGAHVPKDAGATEEGRGWWDTRIGMVMERVVRAGEV